MGHLEVFVCVFADDLITLNVDSSTTVQQLMSGILEAGDSAIRTVTKRMNDYGDKDYMLLCRGINLLEHPSSTLTEMCIKDHDHIYLSRRGFFHVHFKLFPMMSRSWPSIPVEAHEELIQLKEKISRMCSLVVSESELDLYYCCQCMTDDHRPLAYYGIFIRRDMVDVDPPDSFHYEILAAAGSDRYSDRLPLLFLHKFGSGSIHPPDSEIIVECAASMGTIRLRVAAKCSDTIGTLKSNICAKVPIDDGRSPLGYILEDLYMLIFNRKELEDGSLTLDECGIKAGDRIQLCPKGSFLITVILALGELTLRKEVLAVDVRSSETVGTLKAKIRVLESIPSKKHILLRFKEKWLADDQKCLPEYGIMELPLTHRCSDYYMRKAHNCIVEALTYG